MSHRSRTGDTGGSGTRRATPPNVDTMHSLKVDNLTYRTRVEDLRKCFEKFGPIGDIYIPRDQFSRSSRGYAFIRFSTKRDAQTALDRMDGADLDGREIRVQFARYGRASALNSRDKVRYKRTRSRSNSRRRSRSRSKRRSRSRSPRRSSRSKRNNRHVNSDRNH